MSTLPPKNVKPGSLNCVVFTMKRWQSNHYGYLVCTLSRQLQGHVLTFFWAKTDIAHCVPPLQTVNYGPKSKYIWSLSLFRAHQTGYCFVSLITYIGYGRKDSVQWLLPILSLRWAQRRPSSPLMIKLLFVFCPLFIRILGRGHLGESVTQIQRLKIRYFCNIFCHLNIVRVQY